MARTSAVALTALLLSSMALLALASVPVVKNSATQGTIEQQPEDRTSSPYTRLPALRRLSAARKLLLAGQSTYTGSPLPFQGLTSRQLQASTPTSDRDLEDRSAAVANPLLQSAYKRFEAAAAAAPSAPADAALPFRRLLAPSLNKGLEERLAFTTAAAAVPNSGSKRLEAAAATDSNADDTIPFRRLLARDHTSDRDLEDRSAAVANPTLAAAVKRLEAESAAGSAGASPAEALPFRRLQARDHTSDRELEDRSAAVANPTLAAAVKRLEADAASSSVGVSPAEALPFRRLLARDHTSDRDLEDRSAAVADPLLQSAYKRFEAAQAADGDSTGTPFRRLLAAAN